MGAKPERYQESHDDDAPREWDDCWGMFDCIWGISVFTGDILFETEYLEVRLICLTCGNVLDCCTCQSPILPHVHRIVCDGFDPLLIPCLFCPPTCADVLGID